MYFNLILVTDILLKVFLFSTYSTYVFKVKKMKGFLCPSGNFIPFCKHSKYGQVFIVLNLFFRL